MYTANWLWAGDQALEVHITTGTHVQQNQASELGDESFVTLLQQISHLIRVLAVYQQVYQLVLLRHLLWGWGF